MNSIRKKLVSLFLIFSLTMLPTSLYAKKRGAKLIITKKDGQHIQGELIAAKQNSLLLLLDSGIDVTIDIRDVKKIKIKDRNKSKAGKGALYGSLIGGVIGVCVNYINVRIHHKCVCFFGKGLTAVEAAAIGGIASSLLGALAGVIIGGFVGKKSLYKTIQIEGMTDSRIQETLDYLRKKARIRDYK